MNDFIQSERGKSGPSLRNEDKYGSRKTEKAHGIKLLQKKKQRCTSTRPAGKTRKASRGKEVPGDRFPNKEKGKKKYPTNKQKGGPMNGKKRECIGPKK